MLKLYSHPHSPYCRKVKLVLEEKRIPYEDYLVDLELGSQRQEKHLALNPFGKVPVIQDGDMMLFESAVIVEYLEDQYPRPNLMPSSPQEKAFVRLMERVHDEWVQPLVDVLFKQYFYRKPISRDQQLVAETFKKIREILRWYDQKLGEKKYFGGTDFSIADASLTHNFLNFFPQFNIDLSEYPGLKQWSRRMLDRASVQLTNPGWFRSQQIKRMDYEFRHKRSA